MIVCTQCGHRNGEGDDFCGSCGAFLEFAGQREEQPTTVSTAPTPAAVETEHPGVVARVKQIVGLGNSPANNPPVGTDGADGLPWALHSEEQVRLDDQARVAGEREQRATREQAAAEQAARMAEESAVRAATQAQQKKIAAQQIAQAASEQRLADQAERDAEREQRRVEGEQHAQREQEEFGRSGAEQRQAAERAAIELLEAERRAQNAAAELAGLEEAAVEGAAGDRTRRELLTQQARVRDGQASTDAARAATEVAAQDRLERARQEVNRKARDQARVAREEQEHQQRKAEDRAQLEAEERVGQKFAAADAAAISAADEAAQLEAEKLARAKAAREAAARAEQEATAARDKQEEADRARRRATAMVAVPRPGTPTQAGPALPAPTAVKNTGRSADPLAGKALAVGAPVAREAAAEEVLARRPTAERAHRVAPAPISKAPEPINPGDLVCGNCGVGNLPDRKFCRRCGASLVTASLARRHPWYRRVFTRRRKFVAAGERHGRAKEMALDTSGRNKRKVAPLLKRVAKISAAGAVLVVLAVPSLRSEVTGYTQSAYRKIRAVVAPNYSRVTPTAARATSSLPGHPAALLIDGVNQTWWAESARGTGIGQRVTVVFKDAVDIDRVGFKVGASTQPADFTTQPRPRAIHLAFDDGSTKDLKLKDSPDLQTYGVAARKIKQMTLEIRSVVAGQKGTSAAIAELEFFVKS